MQLAIVKGTLVATQKADILRGIALRILQPCDDLGRALGDEIVAVDTIGSREGDRVMWVGKREASLVFDDVPLANNYPVDAAVTGIIDDIS